MNRPTVWLVVDQLPYPPRNGVTVPTYNYAIALRERADVRVLLLCDQGKEPSQAELDANSVRLGTVEVRSQEPLSAWCRLRQELAGTGIYAYGWKATRDPLPIRTGDKVLASPMPAIVRLAAASRVKALAIAAVNDCTTAEYAFRQTTGVTGWKAQAKVRLDRLRARLVARSERFLLKDYRRILLQTERDRQLLVQLVDPSMMERVVLAPNGVATELFDINTTNSNEALFLADLSAEYAPLAHWLLKDVWPLVVEALPASRLHVVGKGASTALRSLMDSMPSVRYTPFAANLKDVYSDAAVVLSPIWKGYGLINKSLEGLAAGKPVVGGAAAFNGVDGFKPDIHGVKVSDMDHRSYAEAVATVLRNPAGHQEMGERGRQLVASQFSWRRTGEILARQLEL